MAGGSYKGIIGNELLERYNVVLDLRDSLIYLQRNPAYEVPRDGKPWGISFVDRTDICDAWIVSAIRVGGPADEAGVSPGDSVVSINGKPVTGLDVEEVYAVMDSLSVLNLVLKDGRDVKDLRIVCGNENL
jgi:predicted metalloprotease with PDZ domain